MLPRLARIAAIAGGFLFAFTLSQRATAAREGQTLPGIGWAVGILAILFLVSAIVTERTQGPEADLRKDMMWGLAAGGILIFAFFS